jgi:hypothetical protein
MHGRSRRGGLGIHALACVLFAAALDLHWTTLFFFARSKKISIKFVMIRDRAKKWSYWDEATKGRFVLPGREADPPDRWWGSALRQKAEKHPSDLVPRASGFRTRNRYEIISEKI